MLSQPHLIHKIIKDVGSSDELMDCVRLLAALRHATSSAEVEPLTAPKIQELRRMLNSQGVWDANKYRDSFGVEQTNEEIDEEITMEYRAGSNRSGVQGLT